MATNKVQDGRFIYIATASSAESGDPMVIGSYLPCVLLTDADSDDSNKATVATEGVFDLSVEAVDNDGNSAVSAGDAIYYDSGNDPVLTKKSDGEYFGIALESLATGTTGTINVMLRPKAGVGGVTEEMLSTDMQDKVITLTISAADQEDGTTDVTLQAQDAAGNDLAENVFVRVWTGGADDYGVDALTGITATTGTLVNSHTANGDVDVVTDAAGTAVLAMDNNGAGSIYVWAAVAGHVYESGELTITAP
jgi:predicted RecA/RadA family phage recombinase